MDTHNIRVVAMDLDGTLTQHKSPLSDRCRRTLENLAKRYRLLMLCAGGCERVYRQMGEFPVAISGFYGMQYAEGTTGGLHLLEDNCVLIDRDEVSRKVALLREEFGLMNFTGETVEFHESGLITFPILGTKACLEDKLAYDPDRAKRRLIYDRVCEVFSEYHVFIGGSSSFDIAPKPYNKLFALDRYLARSGLNRENVVFFGDDYGPGGNDRDVYTSGIQFVPIEDYREFPEIAERVLLDGTNRLK